MFSWSEFLFFFFFIKIQMLLFFESLYYFLSSMVWDVMLVELWDSIYGWGIIKYRECFHPCVYECTFEIYNAHLILELENNLISWKWVLEKDSHSRITTVEKVFDGISWNLKTTWINNNHIYIFWIYFSLAIGIIRIK